METRSLLRTLQLHEACSCVSAAARPDFAVQHTFLRMAIAWRVLFREAITAKYRTNVALSWLLVPYQVTISHHKLLLEITCYIQITQEICPSDTP